MIYAGRLSSPAAVSTDCHGARSGPQIPKEQQAKEKKEQEAHEKKTKKKSKQPLPTHRCK